MQEYPKMLYRDGEGLAHVHIEDPIKVHNQFSVDTLVVNSLDEELVALDDGWRATADPQGGKPVQDARDAEIIKLREQLAQSIKQETRRGPGRPRTEVIHGDAA